MKKSPLAFLAASVLAGVSLLAADSSSAKKTKTAAKAAPAAPAVEVLPRLAHNNPGALADLGVGLWAWPLPLD